MKTPRIDFVRVLGRHHRERISLPTGLLVALSLLMTVAVSWQLVSIEIARAGVRSQLHTLQAQERSNQSPAAAAHPPAGRDERVTINQAIRQLNLPWPQIFDAVESATSDAIAILSLTPDAASETLSIVAESQTTDSMLAYVSALKAQPLFDQVVMARHEINEKDSHRPIRFEVAAHWRTRP